jgi:hypothetical protein
VMGLPFSPFSAEYGPWTWIVRSQFLAEAIVCLALFFELHSESTKAWFHSA